jgi:hypothetical protein
MLNFRRNTFNTLEMVACTAKLLARLALGTVTGLPASQNSVKLLSTKISRNLKSLTERLSVAVTFALTCQVGAKDSER